MQVAQEYHNYCDHGQGDKHYDYVTSPEQTEFAYAVGITSVQEIEGNLFIEAAFILCLNPQRILMNTRTFIDNANNTAHRKITSYATILPRLFPAQLFRNRRHSLYRISTQRYG